jgi:hypothetical protein
MLGESYGFLIAPVTVISRMLRDVIIVTKFRRPPLGFSLVWRKVGGLDIHLKLDLWSSSHQCFGNFHVKRVLFAESLLYSLSCLLIDLDSWTELAIKLKNVTLNF